MTLILTQLNQHGIAMAADSAVTTTIPLPNGKTRHRVLHGARKLQRVPHIDGGVACWGQGTIGKMPTEVWLEQHVEASSKVTSDLDQFANHLEAELNTAIPPGSPDLGFHVAGYTTTTSGLAPAFYHVHNDVKTPSAGTPKIFSANLDKPPQAYQPGQWHITRNGDYQFYAQFFQYLLAFVQQLPQSLPNFAIPRPDNLYTHARYLAFQIQTVSALYDVAGMVPGIGGPITIMGIGSQGCEFYEPY